MTLLHRPYNKILDYSYTLGVFPTLELLNNQPGKVIKIILSSKSFENTGVEKIKQLCDNGKLAVEVSDNIINRLSPKENCYAIGVFNKYESQVNQNENHLVLVGIRDMGNLGTICRTMLGFNINNLAIIKPAADIFDPKSIRSSMGAAFQINFQYFNNFEDYQKMFTNNLYPFMTDGKEALSKVNFKPPYSLIFGSESAGLDKKYHRLGTSVNIPQGNKIDSLNLSVAVGIALYQTSTNPN